MHGGMASQGNDSDDGTSLTPSEQSEGEERSEHDSDYETDDGTDEIDDCRDKNLNIIWTGFSKRTPVILFNPNSILQKKSNFKTAGEQFHLAFKFGTNECKIIRNILLAHGFHEVHPNNSDFNLIWTNGHLKPFTLRTLAEFQKINHFPRSYELTRKDRMFKNIQRMQQIKGPKHFDFVPMSFVLPGEYQEFCSQFLKDKGPWIIKPVASSRGRGVYIISHPEQVPLDENLIICRYIDNPLVIDGFKFDIRLYVAVTSYDPLVIYIYEEGLTRFATVKYDRTSKHLRNQCMHLTNYSVNKKSNDYVRNDDPDVEDYGNKWSMGAMLRYLRAMGKDTAALMMRIEDVVIKTILSGELSIATACKMFMPYRGNCFELYGFDILLDDTLKPWVLEVNLSPSLACDSPLDLKIKANMLCDLFSLAGIICHDPMQRSCQQQSRRNQEFAAKIARSKQQKGLWSIDIQEESSAFTRPVSARPKSRPQSAGLSTKASNSGTAVNVSGLSGEEIKIIRRVREEEQRKGGWIRIFPGPDTWDVHGQFLQFNTTHNLMLHQRLYPERHKKVLTAKAPAAPLSSAASRSKTAYVQIIGGQPKTDAEKTIESYTLALLRARQYERKLGSRSRRRKNRKKGKGAHRSHLVQGVIADEEEGEGQYGEEDEGDDVKQDDNVDDKPDEEYCIKTTNNSDNVAVTTSDSSDDVNTGTKEVTDQEAKRITLPPSPPPSEPQYNVVELLIKGKTLNKVQARSAFAMYLFQVKQRLITETGPLRQEDVDALNEQMDLVLRFLKRAAINLQQSFRVIVPSRKLPLGDRRRILAKQLGDFVQIYNNETEQLNEEIQMEKDSSQSKTLDNDCELDKTKFEKFVSTASEGELEELLTTYTKLNKSASIFLGGSSSKSETSSTKPAESSIVTNGFNSEMGHGDSQERTKSFGENQKANSSSSTNEIRDFGNARRVRPSSGSSQSSYTNAVSIYTQKLVQPNSARIYKPQIKTLSRPSSAQNSKPSPYSTSEPVVDTYNEQAFHEALQRLVNRQQARMYSTIHSSGALKSEVKNPNPTHPSSSSTSHHHTSAPHQEESPIDMSFFDDLNYAPVLSLGARRSDSRLHNASGPRYVSKEDFKPQFAMIQSSKPPHPSMKRATQTNVHMQNANDTFNNFIDETTPQWQNEIASAYSQVTGVPPNHYHTASVGSRQYQLAVQQQAKRSSIDLVRALSQTSQRPLQQQYHLAEQQSRSNIDANKAKHHAMVAQAHAAQRSISSPHMSNGRVMMHHVDIEANFAPKPPLHPAPSRSKHVHKLSKVPQTDESPINFNFYRSLQYDTHTGQVQKKSSIHSQNADPP